MNYEPVIDAIRAKDDQIAMLEGRLAALSEMPVRVVYRPGLPFAQRALLTVNGVDLTNIVSRVVVEAEGEYSTVTLTLPACAVEMTQ